MGASTFRVVGMTCAACAARVETALRAVPGVVSADVDVVRRRVRIDAPSVDVRVLESAVRDAGYGLEHEERSDDPSIAEARRAAAAVAVAVAAFAVDVGWLPSTSMPWIPLVALLVSAPRIARGLLALVRLRPGMESLVAASATATAMVALFGIGPHSGHDSGSTTAHLLAAVATGAWLETRLRARAAAAFERTAAAIPRTATLQDGRRVDATTLVVGDVFVVAVGERCATNAVVVDGEGAADESLLSGESAPVPKVAGDTVWGGTVLIDGPLRVESTAAHADSRIVRMRRALEAAQATRSPGLRWSDAVLARFVPVVFLASIVAAVIHGVAGDWWGGLSAAVATLAVACPCALGLAVPAALAAAFSGAMSRGIIVRDAATLERLADVDLAAFDKTGTLTERGLRVVDFHVTEGDPRRVAALAAAVCAGSRHPAAQAFGAWARTREGASLAADGFLKVPRGGDGAWVDGTRVHVGSRAFMESLGFAVSDAADGGMFVACDGNVVGRATFGEVLRAEARDAVEHLKARGVRIAILSGDAEPAVRRVADALNLDVAFGGLGPEGKAAYVSARRAEGARVAMIGDGLNDGAAFAAADVGVAVGVDADFAATSASVIIADGSPAKFVALLALAAKARSVMRRNLVFAVVYNAVAAPLAMAGVLPPAWCAAAMAASSVLVVAHAATLAEG